MQELKFNKEKWEKVSLGDIVFEPKETAKNIIEEGFEHIVGLEHIDSDDIHLKKSFSVETETTFTKVFRKGDVLFGRRRAYLKKAAQATFDGVCSGDITVLRAKENIDSRLLPFIIHNEKFFDYAVKHSAGGLSPRVKFKDLANYEFLLPPKQQQAELADLLWAMDEVIEKDLMILDRLDSIKKIIVTNFFSEDFGNYKKLGDLVVIRSGESSSTFNLVDKKKGIPYLKVADLNESVIYQDFSKEWVLQGKKKPIEKDSVIFPKRGAAIMTNKVRILLEDSYLDTNLMALKPKNKNILSSEFLHIFLEYIELFKIADVAQIPQINNIHINPLVINLPIISKQDNFIKKLTDVSRIKSSLGSKLQSSKALQKSLINQIF
jgi:type I restriction enzyme, S subunit